MNKIFAIIFFVLTNLVLHSEIRLDLSKPSYDFGIVPSCKKVYDTIVVKNSAVSTANIKLYKNEKIIGDNSNFRIANPKIKDLDLPPYDGTNSVIYIIEFDASIGTDGIKNAVLHIPTDLPAPNDTLKIPINATSERIKYTINTTEIDFGNIIVANNYSSQISFKLNSNFEGNIDFVKKQKSEITLDTAGFEYILKPFVDKSINFTLNLTQYGLFEDTIYVVINTPCDTILAIPIKANAPKTNIGGFAEIDLGSISPCQTKIDSSFFHLLSYGSAECTNVKYESNDNQNFEFSISKDIPFTITDPQDTIFYWVKANNITKVIGEIEVIATFTFIINGETIDYKTKIRAKFEEFDLNSDKKDVIFPAVYQNVSSFGNFTLTNPTDVELQIEKITFDCPDANLFNIIPNAFPAFIAGGGKLDYQVEFTPDKPAMSVNCRIKIYYTDGYCYDSLLIDLSATSLNNGKYSLAFGNLTELNINPKDDILEIPVNIKATESMQVLSDTLIYEVVFPRSVFYPELLTDNAQNTIIKNYLENDNRVLQIQSVFSNQIITDSGIEIAKVQGIPLLGNLKKGYFKFRGTNFSNNSLLNQVAFTDSLQFTLTTCQAGGDRLTEFNNQSIPRIEIKTQENGQIAITYFATESGLHTIGIYNQLGQIYKTKIMKFEWNSQNNIVFNNLPNSQVYFVIINSPTEIHFGKFINE